MLHPRLTINCKGKLLSLAHPLVMGILNATPDSFFDGGQYDALDAAVAQAGRMLEEGATIIDVGGMSSRPGAKIIETSQELDRVIPIIAAIRQHFPESIISIDTVKAKVAKEAIAAGASIINDISAGDIDSELWTTVAELGVPYILMHMQGKPANMQQAPAYEDVVEEVLDFLIARVGRLKELGIYDVIIDPGFGFGKSVAHNYQLLKKMHVFKILGLPILAGVSRKSMINKVLKIKAKDALNGTTALHMIALQQGAKILRVHDVKPAVETIRLFQELEKY